MYTETLLSASSVHAPMARRWLLLGVAALAVAGLFAVILVLAREPHLSQYFPLFSSHFREALVVHVNLSALIWFLAVTCMIFSLEAARRRESRVEIPFLEEAALISFALGTGLIALSPLAGGEGLISNYIPAISNPLFFLGLSISLTGVGLQTAHLALRRRAANDPLVFAAAGSGLIFWLAMAAFVAVGLRMPEAVEGQQYYDMLFWAGGHLLQFAYVQAALFAWFALGGVLGIIPGWLSRRARWVFAAGPVFCLPGLLPLAFMDPAMQDFRQFYTHHMMLLGLAPTLACLGMLWGWKKAGWKLPAAPGALKWAFLLSVFLFLYGGFLGGIIRGQDTTIPAHYHGSIGGLTLAFMGLTYLLLSRFGFREVARTRLARWQPWIYTTGQALHITGLAVSGGYGALRKTPGAPDLASQAAKMALHIGMGGGLLAIAGGLMFVLAVWRSVKPAR